MTLLMPTIERAPAREQKRIAGVLHTRVQCCMCKGMVWTQSYYFMRGNYRCNSCDEPKASQGIGRADPVVAGGVRYGGEN